MLWVFILWVPTWAQGRVHVPRSGIAGWMHRWAGITAVSRWHIWPPGGDRCRVQARSAAHQARLHPRHLTVELVLWKKRGGAMSCIDRSRKRLQLIMITIHHQLIWQLFSQLIYCFFYKMKYRSPSHNVPEFRIMYSASLNLIDQKLQIQWSAFIKLFLLMCLHHWEKSNLATKNIQIVVFITLIFHL